MDWWIIQAVHRRIDTIFCFNLLEEGYRIRDIYSVDGHTVYIPCLHARTLPSITTRCPYLPLKES